MLIKVSILFLIIAISPFCLAAQEENAEAVKYGSRYVELRLKSLNKFESRVKHQQERMLRKLKRKEARMGRKLKRCDSVGYARFQERNISYDSIDHLSKNDSNEIADDLAVRRNDAVDSIKGVQSFVQSKSEAVGFDAAAISKDAAMSELQKKLNYRKYLDELISKRGEELKGLRGLSGRIPGLKGIEKQIFYGRAKIGVFKEMQEEPTVAEEKAMEVLQGTKGFDEHISNATQGGDGSMQSLMQNGAGLDELEAMGYQTRRQMQDGLKERFGNSVGDVSKQMSVDVDAWNDKQQELGNLKDAKQSFEGMGRTEKLSFKVNEMRGLPFWKRVEKQYSFETARAGSDGAPATMTPSAMVAFKHTAKLKYGVGAACAIGLGESWQNIHFSFRGVGVRTFASWEWEYGISGYAGYERMYKQFAFIKDEGVAKTDIISTRHNTIHYSESILVGLTKSYKVNKKYNGAMQVLYDIWWRQKGLNSPIVLRIVTNSK